MSLRTAAISKFLLRASLLFPLSAMGGDGLTFADWIVERGGDGNTVAAITSTGNEAAFGEWCFNSSKSCTWELLIDISCTNGESHLFLANSTSSYAALKANCLGKADDGDVFVYAFNWVDLENLIRNPKRESQVAFAMPMKNTQFRVVRFSLNGLREATGAMEKRFFKGAQPHSINDETL